MKHYVKQLKNVLSMKQIKIILIVTMLGIGMLSGWAQSGDFGDALHWKIEDGTLTISGMGAMPDMDISQGNMLWLEYYYITITQVMIENGVTSIGSDAFNNLHFLTSVTIPESVKRIGDRAFVHCSSLTSVTIPESVQSIGDEAFYGCSALTSITIPNSVQSIGSGIEAVAEVFYGCNSLTSITVENTNPSYMSEDGILFNNAKTKLIVCPAGKSGSYAIPEGVTSIEDFAFDGCNSLTAITIPNSVTSIGLCAFQACSNLTSIIIPNGVTKIEEHTFNNCSNLTSVTIPESVTSIGDRAFRACSSLTSFINYNAKPQTVFLNTSTGYSTFGDVNLSAATLYVPCGSQNAYKSVFLWQDFGRIEEMNCDHHYIIDNTKGDNMTVTAMVLLNSQELQNGHWEIGVFCGGECRGSALMEYYSSKLDHPYLGMLTVHGNAGEEITFRVYNHDTDKEYTANSSLNFVDDEENTNRYMVDNPYSIYITDILTQTVPLNKGWSWISVNVADINNPLINQFKASIGANGEQLSGKDNSIQYSTKVADWLGLLEITNMDMYRVETAEACNLLFTGLPVDPAATPITLSYDWNWIGYTPQVSMSVDDALANLTNPQNDDIIKSRTSFDVYYAEGQGWIGGDLSTMNPGEGYKYYSTNATAQTFVYPSSALRSSRNNAATLPLKWAVNANRFANNMTVTFIVSQDDEELQNTDIEIGAFCGDDCRGSARLKNIPQLANHPYMGFLMIHGENNEPISLRIYNHATGEEYKADNSLTFVTDAIHGSLAAPFKITTSPTGISNIQSGSVTVYLDPLHRKLIIRYPWSSIDRLEIVDLNGRIIWQGTNFASESVDVSSLTKGVYILKLVKDNQVSVYKFVK